jgi:DNA-binding response OmpR family regulator
LNLQWPGGDKPVKQFRILVVDDEERILNFLRSKLRASGYEVLTAGNGLEALEQAQAQEPDLIVLDLLMPKMDGFETLKELRSFSAVPVIILSAKGTDVDRIKGLGLGADDYLPKPFNPDELVARIEAVKRRLEPAEKRKTTDSLSFGDLTIDFKSRIVALGRQQKYLTRIEWLLLSELARNAGRLLTYEDLLSTVWGPEYRDDVQILRTWISRLRYKLESGPTAPRLIRTVPKVGYIIDQPSN